MAKLLVGTPLTNHLDQAIRDIFKVLYGQNPACFVCGRVDGWFKPKVNPRGCQVGHFIARGRTRLRWDLKNLFPQCSGCNKNHNYNPAPFALAVVQKIGVERLSYLEETARRAVGDKMTNTEKRLLLTELLAYKEELTLTH